MYGVGNVRQGDGIYRGLRTEVSQRKSIQLPKGLPPGVYLPAQHSSSVLLIIQGGWNRKCGDYVEFLARPLAERYHVYIAELRTGTLIRKPGACFAWRCVKDLLGVHEAIQTQTGATQVVYVGHSMGGAIAAEVIRRGARDVRGFYGMAAYPSLGDSQDLEKSRGRLRQRLFNALAASRWGPFAYPLKGQRFDIPCRFAIGGKDARLNTDRPEIRTRFEALFERVGHSSTAVIEEGDHYFGVAGRGNRDSDDDASGLFVQDIQSFTEHVIEEAHSCC